MRRTKYGKNAWVADIRGGRRRVWGESLAQILITNKLVAMTLRQPKAIETSICHFSFVYLVNVDAKRVCCGAHCRWPFLNWPSASYVLFHLRTILATESSPNVSKPHCFAVNCSICSGIQSLYIRSKGCEWDWAQRMSKIIQINARNGCAIHSGKWAEIMRHVWRS